VTSFVFARREFVFAKRIMGIGSPAVTVHYDLRDEVYLWLEERFPEESYQASPHGTHVVVGFTDENAAMEFKIRWG
jgi:hypothetical protein